MTPDEGRAAMPLASSWRRAWSGLRLAGDGADTHRRLLAAYAEPHRRYHTLQHLSECMAAFESVMADVPHPAEVEMALWFHDALYDTKRSDNEQRSAEWAISTLAGAGATAESIRLVERLVLVTKHDGLPQTPDEEFLVDIDLAILGADAQRFAEFERQVREEYAFVPGFLFRMKRRSILATFLERKSIYGTPYFRSRLEAVARHNLESVIRGGVA